MNNLNINNLYEAIQQLKALTPPRYEIWLSKAVPQKTALGDPFVLLVNANEIEPALETINNSDFVYFVNPTTWQDCEHELGLRSQPDDHLPSLSIPVYDDKFRAAHWKRKHEKRTT